jgi:hypothetical protein
VFPASCQLAVQFAAATGSSVDNACGKAITHKTDATGNPSNAVLGAGPFPELGMAADLAMGTYYETQAVLDKSGDTTVQLWVKIRTVDPVDSAWPFSDLDLDAAGGLGIAIYDSNGLKLEVDTCTNPMPLAFSMAISAYPTDGGWHFVRAVHSNGNVDVCLDGKMVASFASPAGKLMSTFHPYLGKNVVWTPAGAFLDGEIDDVRVLSTALPCP